MLLRLLSQLIPGFIKRQIQYFVQMLSGYSPEIQRHQKYLEELREKKMLLEQKVSHLEQIVKKLAVAIEVNSQRENLNDDLRQRANTQFLLSVKSDTVSMHEALIPGEAIRLVTRDGFDRYPGGIYNPGCFNFENKSYFLARGEKHMEIARAQDAAKMMKGSTPLLIEHDRDYSVRSIEELSFQGFSSKKKYRIEDFRVFSYQGDIYSHHSLIQFPPYFKYRNDKTYFSGQVISKVDFQRKSLEYFGSPVLDRDLDSTEKNWLFLEHESDVYLFYAFAPDFIVQKLVSWKHLRFKTFIDEPLHILGLQHIPFISFSSNPVSYSPDHYILFVHARRGKQILDYLHWGVLIEKKTLRPAYITKCPVVRGGAARGVYPHVLFITGVISNGDNFDLVMGEGDYYTSVATLERSLFEKNLIPIRLGF